MADEPTVQPTAGGAAGAAAPRQPEQTPKERAGRRRRDIALPPPPAPFAFNRPFGEIKLDFARRMWQRFRVQLFFYEVVGQNALVPASKTWVMTDEEKDKMTPREKLHAITLILREEDDPDYIPEPAARATNGSQSTPRPEELYYRPQGKRLYFEPERPIKGVLKAACNHLNLSGYTERVNEGIACAPEKVLIGRGPYDDWYEHHIPTQRGSSIRIAGVKRYVEVEFELFAVNQMFTGQQLFDLLLAGSPIGMIGNRSFGSGRYNVLAFEWQEITSLDQIPWWLAHRNGQPDGRRPPVVKFGPGG